MKKALFSILLTATLLPYSVFAFSTDKVSYTVGEDIIISDIGGTCSRLGIFQDGNFLVQIDNQNSYTISSATIGNYTLIALDSCYAPSSKTITDFRNAWSYQSEATISVNSALKSGVLFGRTGESQTANQNGGSMLAAVGVASAGAFTGIWPYLMLSAGVFIGFYIIEQVAMAIGNRGVKEAERIRKKK